MDKNFFAIFLLFVFISCNKETPTNGAIELNGIPFLTGAQNLYEWTVNVDSTGLPIYFERDSLTVTVLSNTEQLYGYLNLTLLEIKSLKYVSANSRVWYLNSTDSLSEVAYSGAGSVPIIMPKNGKRIDTYSDFSIPYTVKKFVIRNRQNSDSIMKREDVRIVYRFPLKLNDSWVSFTYPFFQKREVVGAEIVNIKAGQFLCTKIKTDIYFSGKKDTALIWYDYVAQEGLILRTISFNGFLTTEQSPDSLIPISSFERSELISRK